MNLIDAILLYAHVLQQAGYGLEGRKAALDALNTHNIDQAIIDSIARAVSNDGELINGEGLRFMLTQITNS